MSAPHSMIGGKNFVINGGTFNQTVARTGLSICFDKLASKASPLAFHLADSDLSHSTCFTNTRTKILERIKGWALYNSEKDKFVMWLHGPAGGGKTAIGRTIAKWCQEEGILLGEFFFSRTDGTGGQLASLAPTLAYRMAVHTLQDAKGAISNVVSHDPHIFLAPLAVQLKKLVLDPLDLLAPSGIVPYVIILDGLDETLSPDDQQLVLNVISETLYPLNPRLRILICCRPEPTIVTAFNDTDSPLNAISTNISLNDDVDSDADIRAFLVEKFARTKKLLPHPPTEDWPTAENIGYLVAKSSGQFIFAATVDKYVCSPRHRHQAVARLKHVLDLRLLPHLEDKKKHPFADLDALYSLILRTRNDVNMSVKATAVCLEYPTYFNTILPTDLAKVLDIELSETWAILYELASLFDASKEGIRPFHASFGDFLFDSSRSLDCFCSRGDIVADITYAMVKRGRDPEVLSYHVFSHLLGEATPRQDL
ncbi:hypothetical protein BYT27DRAFT_6821236 [Phlegmacium glaucopus]|nr:hypothetical protein BYT27DRAFT_6821236 [Phlegmacium glaucopus]